jgi:hypothetical protein
VPERQVALALETAPPGEFPGASPAQQLAAFRDRLLAQTRLTFTLKDAPTGQYTDRSGHTLRCVFDGPDAIDGVPVDYAQWPVLECPWLHQARGS